MSAPDAAPPRPGLLGRAAAGAWHVPAGLALLVGRPALWPLAALPALLAAALLVLGAAGGVFAVPHVDQFLTGGRPAQGALDLIETVAIWLVTPLAGALSGLGLALLASAPILERLSRRVEIELVGHAAESGRGLAWEVRQGLRGAAYVLLRAPFVLLTALVPLVGPLIAALWGAHVVTIQMAEAPLARRGLDFHERRAWHRNHRAESLGFGLAAVFMLAVPLANLLLAPGLAVGATRLVVELSELARRDG
jgi:CysZ protein